MSFYTAATVTAKGALRFNACPWPQRCYSLVARFMVTAAHTNRIPDVGQITPEARYWFQQGQLHLRDALCNAVGRHNLIKWRQQDTQLVPLLNYHRLLNHPDVVRIISHVVEAITYYQTVFTRIYNQNTRAAVAAAVGPTAHSARSENVRTAPGPVQSAGNSGRVEGSNSNANTFWTAAIPRHGSQIVNRGTAPGSSALNPITVDGGEESVRSSPGLERAVKRRRLNDNGCGGSGSSTDNAIILDGESATDHARPANVPGDFPAGHQGEAATFYPPVTTNPDNSEEIQQARPVSAPTPLKITAQDNAATTSPPSPSKSTGDSENVRKRRRNGPAIWDGLPRRFAQGEQPTNNTIGYHLGIAVPELRRYSWLELEGAGLCDPAKPDLSKAERPKRRSKNKSPGPANLRAANAILADATAASSSAPDVAPRLPVEDRHHEPAAITDSALVTMGSIETDANEESELDDESAKTRVEVGELVLVDPDEAAREFRAQNRQASPELSLEDAMQAAFDAQSEYEEDEEMVDEETNEEKKEEEVDDDDEDDGLGAALMAELNKP